MRKIALLLLFHLLFFVAVAHGQPVRIAYLQSDVHHLPCWVALEKGFFDKEGVKVKVHVHGVYVVFGARTRQYEPTPLGFLIHLL